MQRYETPGGLFLRLEETCRKIGLSYCRSDDGHYAYPPAVTYWAPGMHEPIDWLGSQDHHPCLTYEDIKTRRDSGALEACLEMMARADAFNVPLTLLATS